MIRGSNVNYGLRANKHVERTLFIELLNILCSNHVNDYVYVSMAGPQLADLIQVHFDVGIHKLVSIEADENVRLRQEFNIRPGCMECLHQTSKEFVEEFDVFESRYKANEKFIVWLDFADSKQRFQQLTELETLVASLNPGDVVKITLNGNYNTVKAKLTVEENELDIDEKIALTHLKKKAHIKSMLGKYGPQSIDDDELNEDGFLAILTGAINNSINKGLESVPGCSKLSVSAFAYNDGFHTMITSTAIIVADEELADKAAYLNSKWDYMPDENNSFVDIDVPALSLKERLYLESKFYKESIEQINESLSWRLGENTESSLHLLAQYNAHYRRYPGYLPIRI